MEIGEGAVETGEGSVIEVPDEVNVVDEYEESAAPHVSYAGAFEKGSPGAAMMLCLKSEAERRAGRRAGSEEGFRERNRVMSKGKKMKEKGR